MTCWIKDGARQKKPRKGAERMVDLLHPIMGTVLNYSARNT